MNHCKCNCGQLVNNEWVIGHHRKGTTFNLSEEAKEKIRKHHTGSGNPMFGKIPHNWKGGKETKRLRKVISQQNREAKKKKNGGTITTKEWLDLINRFDYMCLCCKRKEPEIKLTMDHIIPISIGGKNEISNIQPLCRNCNSRKQSKHIDFISEYYQIKEKSIS